MYSGNNDCSQQALTLKLGVTDLVRFAARQGDLFSDDFLGPDAQAGLRGHQQIQKSRKPPWQVEYALSHVWQIHEVEVVLSGRVDLLNNECEPVIVEEIKTCFGAGHLLPPQRKALHWAQLQVYAALYACESTHNTSNAPLCMRVSYFDLVSQQIYQEEETIYAQEALAYCQDLLQIYVAWWQRVTAQQNDARKYCQHLQFPHSSYRPGQRESAIWVYRQIRDGGPLLIDAPTGTGKTLSVVFPALKAFAEKHCAQTLYLTAKGSTQGNALNCLTLLDPTHQLDFLVLQARDKACVCLSADANRRDSCATESGMCARTLGFYDRLPAARLAALNVKHLTPDVIQQLAEQFQLCPFAFSIHLVPWFTLVIADINYFFDPLVRLGCFQESGAQRVLLIDEAHNLASRARDMYSGELNGELCRAVYKSLPQQFHMLRKPLGKLLNVLRLLDHTQLQEQQLPQLLSFTLQELLQGLQQTGDNGFAGGLLEGVPQQYRQWVKEIYRFVAILQLKSEAHVFMLEALGKENCLKIRCLDAAAHLKKLHTTAKTSIAFSATLQPFSFSLQQLGLPGNTQCLQLPRWFPPHNQLTLCCRFISTEWQQRENSVTQLAELIHLFHNAKPGHYLIFFPSYAYLEMTLQKYQQLFPNDMVQCQQAETSDEQRYEFINRFLHQKQSLLGFAIVGGVYAEGIDYAGDALIGAMIIGTGMPQPSEEQQLMADYYRAQGLNAYQMAYQFPGLIRLLQTAGRVIRSERDRGVVMFVEPRLARQDYQALLSHHWPLAFSDSQQHTEELLCKFWGNAPHDNVLAG